MRKLQPSSAKLRTRAKRVGVLWPVNINVSTGTPRLHPNSQQNVAQALALSRGVLRLLHWPKLSVKGAKGCRSRVLDGVSPAKCRNNRGLRYSAIAVAHAVRCKGAGEPGSPRIPGRFQACLGCATRPEPCDDAGLPACLENGKRCSMEWGGNSQSHFFVNPSGRRRPLVRERAAVLQTGGRRGVPGWREGHGGVARAYGWLGPGAGGLQRGKGVPLGREHLVGTENVGWGAGSALQPERAPTDCSAEQLSDLRRRLHPLLFLVFFLSRKRYDHNKHVHAPPVRGGVSSSSDAGWGAGCVHHATPVVGRGAFIKRRRSSGGVRSLKSWTHSTLSAHREAGQYVSGGDIVVARPTCSCQLSDSRTHARHSRQFQLLCFLFFFPFVLYLHGRARPLTYIRASTSRVYLSLPHNAPSVNRTCHTPAGPICSRPFAPAHLPYHSDPWWMRGTAAVARRRGCFLGHVRLGGSTGRAVGGCLEAGADRTAVGHLAALPRWLRHEPPSPRAGLLKRHVGGGGGAAGRAQWCGPDRRGGAGGGDAAWPSL